MQRALQWILIITSTIIINGNAATNDERAERKLVTDLGMELFTQQLINCIFLSKMLTGAS